MRILVDLQGAQSSGSRTRGIGRYSIALTESLIRNKGEHEVIIALSDLFPETIEPLRQHFHDLIPQANIVVWSAPSDVAYMHSQNSQKRGIAERLREAFLTSLNPDFVHVTSLFEGMSDDSVTSVGALNPTLPTSVTLFDLIPYLHQDAYLSNPPVASWYMDKIDHLRRASLHLAISESSRLEGIEHLGFAPETSVNIGTDADPQFKRLTVDPSEVHRLRGLYNLNRPFLMYTGGVDFRKNIERLIVAYAKLPLALRSKHQLAVVCSVSPKDRIRLDEIATKSGLTDGEFILTGFVPDSDLISLYNLCELFVFPSFHEGFGLPVLEAMRCGAPVIASDRSSLPEVVGLTEALFDPYSEPSMAALMERALTQPEFRTRLVEHSAHHQATFSWDKSGKIALRAMEEVTKARQLALSAQPKERLRLAYISPLPPARSGIADYSAVLLGALRQYYDIDLIVDQDVVSTEATANLPVRDVPYFKEHHKTYDRVMYQFGNSEFHQHMFDLLPDIPGVVVLHDFFLSGIYNFMDAMTDATGLWDRELFRSHGPRGLAYHAQEGRVECLKHYPFNIAVLQDALGTIVHSEHAKSLAADWYRTIPDPLTVIPLARKAPHKDRASARQRLGFKDDDFIVCSFGHVATTKLHHRLVDAWLASSLAQHKSCHLVIVGGNDPGDYGTKLAEEIAASTVGNPVRITGWAEESLFEDYLAAADIAVQLRTMSRGETSAAVLDCMAHGIPTIVNAHGSMAELDPNTVLKMSDDFSKEELVQSLEKLFADAGLRTRIGNAAKETISAAHSPAQCAKQYAAAIERAYAFKTGHINVLASALGELIGQDYPEADLNTLAQIIAQNHPSKPRLSQILVDVTKLEATDPRERAQDELAAVRDLILGQQKGYRVEPVRLNNGRYHYARALTSSIVDFPLPPLAESPIDFAPGDIFLPFSSSLDNPQFEKSLSEFSRLGVYLVSSKSELDALVAKS